MITQLVMNSSAATETQNNDKKWWGQIPHGWQVAKLKHIASVHLSNVDKHTIEGQESVQLCNYTDVYKNEKITSAIPFMRASASDEQIKRLSLQKSDVLLTKDSESPDDIGVPAVVSENLTGVVCGYHLAIARPQSDVAIGEFLFRVLQSEQIKRYYFSRAVGMTRYGLDKQALAETPIALPDLEEQQAIADYLDRETAKLDALIAAKERLLDLLAEKRRALITYAVTRGLNPDVSMRDSGVEWLGEIPAHWEVEFVRWLFTEINERSTTGEEELLTVSHITGVTPRSEKEVYMFMAESLEGYKICQPGDLIINTLWAWMGAMGVAVQKGVVSPSYHVYRPTVQLKPRYVDYLVRMPVFAKEVTRYSKGVWSSRLRLYPEEFFQIILPVPPIEEQYKIVTHLEKELSKLDRLQNALQKTIDFLQERRSSPHRGGGVGAGAGRSVRLWNLNGTSKKPASICKSIILIFEMQCWSFLTQTGWMMKIIVRRKTAIGLLV